MTVSYATFVSEYPEFDAVSEAYVQARLDAAHAMVSESAWGDLYEAVVKVRAADLLARSPYAQNMKLVQEDGETIYSAQFKNVFLPLSKRRGAVL